MSIIVTPIASASARDYNWLMSALRQRAGNRTDLDALLPDFVVLAEKRMNADLESRQQEAAIDLKTEAGKLTVALPIDIAELRSLSLQGGGSLSYLTPDQFSARYGLGEPGQPREYTVIGQALRIGPTPDAAYALNCVYRAYLPPLADSAGTNWLIRDFPNVYLAAAMTELCMQTKKLDELALWEQKYVTAIDSVNKPDWATAGSLFVRSDSPTN